MSANKDEVSVMNFFGAQSELETWEKLFSNYTVEMTALEKKLANGMSQCRETRLCRLNDLQKRLMPQVQGKIEEIRTRMSGGMPLP